MAWSRSLAGWSKLLDVEVTPFEMATTLTVLPDTWRRGVVAVGSALALGVLASIAALPWDPGPQPSEEALHAAFCGRSRMACDGGRVVGPWASDLYYAFREEQLQAWWAAKTAAEAGADALGGRVGLRMGLAIGFLAASATAWRATRPLDVARTGAGLVVGGLRVERGQLAAVEVVGAVPRLRVRTHAGRAWTSPPLWVEGVELDALVAVLDDDVTEPPEVAELDARAVERGSALALVRVAGR